MSNRLIIEMKKERDKASARAHRYEKALLAILDGTFLTEEEQKEIDNALDSDTYEDYRDTVQLDFIDKFIKEVLSK